jgi:hypothetical protein
MKCIVKALCEVKISYFNGTKNPAMLKIGVVKVGCDPHVIPQTNLQTQKKIP